MDSSLLASLSVLIGMIEVHTGLSQTTFLLTSIGLCVSCNISNRGSLRFATTVKVFTLSDFVIRAVICILNSESVTSVFLDTGIQFNVPFPLNMINILDLGMTGRSSGVTINLCCILDNQELFVDIITWIVRITNLVGSIRGCRNLMCIINGNCIWFPISCEISASTTCFFNTSPGCLEFV